MQKTLNILQWLSIALLYLLQKTSIWLACYKKRKDWLHHFDSPQSAFQSWQSIGINALPAAHWSIPLRICCRKKFYRQHSGLNSEKVFLYPDQAILTLAYLSIIATILNSVCTSRLIAANWSTFSSATTFCQIYSNGIKRIERKNLWLGSGFFVLLR